MAKVSVVVPVYNAEMYIDECVKSILNQTYHDIEVLLINDGSTDGSYEQCEFLQSIDTRVKVYNRENSGVSATRNFGISVSSGEYIMFVDADDTLDSKAIEDNLRLIEETSSDLVIFGFRYCILDEKKVHENGVPAFCGSGQAFFDECFSTLCAKEALNPPWNKLIRISLIDKIEMCFDEDISICEDMLFSVRLLSKCNRVVVNERVYYNYKIKSEGSLVFNYHRNYLEAATRAYTESALYCTTFDKNSEQLVEVKQRYVNNILAYVKRLCHNERIEREQKINDIRLICEDRTFRKCLKEVELGWKRKFIRRAILWKKERLILMFYSKMRRK